MSVLHLFVCGLALIITVDAQINLGTGGAYSVFAASTITNTGHTVINGKLGLSPGTAITGFPPGVSSGADMNDGAAITAKTDIQNAYNALIALPVNTDLTGENLGGLTLTSGVYGFSSSGFLTGTLTLDAQGDPNALFVFKFGSTLITASSSSVVLINKAQGCNVFWQVGSSATLGTGTVFIGNILAEASITATTGVVLSSGGLYALTAAVTLDTNTISQLGSCGNVQLGSCGDVVVSSSSTTSAIPAPTTTEPTTT
jgi:Ice-binding-like